MLKSDHVEIQAMALVLDSDYDDKDWYLPFYYISTTDTRRSTKLS